MVDCVEYHDGDQAPSDDDELLCGGLHHCSIPTPLLHASINPVLLSLAITLLVIAVAAKSTGVITVDDERVTSPVKGSSSSSFSLFDHLHVTRQSPLSSFYCSLLLSAALSRPLHSVVAIAGLTTAQV